MDNVKAFHTELISIYDGKPPVSKARMGLITKAALKAVKFYKHIVMEVEKFSQKAPSEYKLASLYVIDSIVRQSRHHFGAEKDQFAPRFAKNFQQTFANILQCSLEDKSKVIRVLNLWQKNGTFPTELIQALLDMANPNTLVNKSNDANNVSPKKSQKEFAEEALKVVNDLLEKCGKDPQAMGINPQHYQQLEVIGRYLKQQLDNKDHSLLDGPDGNSITVDAKVVTQLRELAAQLFGKVDNSQDNLSNIARPDKAKPSQNNIHSINDYQGIQIKDGLTTKENNLSSDMALAGFNKKLLDFDYGDEEDDVSPHKDNQVDYHHPKNYTDQSSNSIPNSYTFNSFPPIDANLKEATQKILTNPGLIKQLQNLTPLVLDPGKYPDDIRKQILVQQQEEFDKEIQNSLYTSNVSSQHHHNIPGLSPQNMSFQPPSCLGNSVNHNFYSQPNEQPYRNYLGAPPPPLPPTGGHSTGSLKDVPLPSLPCPFPPVGLNNTSDQLNIQNFFGRGDMGNIKNDNDNYKGSDLQDKDLRAKDFDERGRSSAHNNVSKEYSVDTDIGKMPTLAFLTNLNPKSTTLHNHQSSSSPSKKGREFSHDTGRQRGIKTTDTPGTGKRDRQDVDDRGGNSSRRRDSSRQGDNKRSHRDEPSRDQSGSKRSDRDNKDRDRDRGRKHQSFHDQRDGKRGENGRHGKNVATVPTKSSCVTVMSRTLWIGRVPKNSTEQDLKNAFQEHGIIPENMNMVPPRGCAYVSFKSRNDAAKILDKMKDKYKLSGKTLQVDWSPFKGLKDKKSFKSYWSESMGAYYIPYDKLEIAMTNDFNDGGAIDWNSVPSGLKAQLEEEIAKHHFNMELSRNSQVAQLNIGQPTSALDNTAPFINTYNMPPPPPTASSFSYPNQASMNSAPPYLTNAPNLSTRFLNANDHGIRGPSPFPPTTSIFHAPNILPTDSHTARRLMFNPPSMNYNGLGTDMYNRFPNRFGVDGLNSNLNHRTPYMPVIQSPNNPMAGNMFYRPHISRPELSLNVPRPSSVQFFPTGNTLGNRQSLSQPYLTNTEDKVSPGGTENIDLGDEVESSLNNNPLFVPTKASLKNLSGTPNPVRGQISVDEISNNPNFNHMNSTVPINYRFVGNNPLGYHRPNFQLLQQEAHTMMNQAFGHRGGGGIMIRNNDMHNMSMIRPQHNFHPFQRNMLPQRHFNVSFNGNQMRPPHMYMNSIRNMSGIPAAVRARLMNMNFGPSIELPYQISQQGTTNTDGVNETEGQFGGDINLIQTPNILDERIDLTDSEAINRTSDDAGRDISKNISDETAIDKSSDSDSKLVERSYDGGISPPNDYSADGYATADTGLLKASDESVIQVTDATLDDCQQPNLDIDIEDGL